MDKIDLSLLPATTSITGNGRLEVGGVDVLDLAAKVGTPAFVYDQSDMRDRFREAYRIFGPGVAYATKAFLCRAVARMAHQEGLSLDVATGGEYFTCRSAGVPAERLVVHGNNKTEAEVTTAVEEGVQWVVIDGFGDLELVSRVATRLRRKVRVLLRVNPGVEVHTHRFTMTGNRRSKFGIPMWTGEAEQALADVRGHSWLDLVGLHMHVGSLVFATDSFLRALDAVADFVKKADLPYFVVGGGLGVRYLNQDSAP
ncbi:MAG: alanine racemase, partial [Micromonosporaceae bacterium]|nr:alanine racemase [Micromonosporaceae bacterium]